MYVFVYWLDVYKYTYAKTHYKLKFGKKYSYKYNTTSTRTQNFALDRFHINQSANLLDSV